MDSEHLRRALLAEFEPRGGHGVVEDRHRDQWRRVAERLREADLGPLIESLSTEFSTHRIWNVIEVASGSDDLLKFAGKLDEARAIIARDNAGFWRLARYIDEGRWSVIFRDIEDVLAQYSEVARAAHRGQGRPISEGFAQAALPHLMAFWRDVLGERAEKKKDTRTWVFCETVIREIARAEGIFPEQAMSGLVGAIRSC